MKDQKLDDNQDSDTFIPFQTKKHTRPLSNAALPEGPENTKAPHLVGDWNLHRIVPFDVSRTPLIYPIFLGGVPETERDQKAMTSFSPGIGTNSVSF